MYRFAKCLTPIRPAIDVDMMTVMDILWVLFTIYDFFKHVIRNFNSSHRKTIGRDISGHGLIATIGKIIQYDVIYKCKHEFNIMDMRALCKAVCYYLCVFSQTLMDDDPKAKAWNWFGMLPIL